MNELLLQKAEAKGSDADFLDWIRRWPSELTGTYSEWVDGEGRNPACHVRRSADCGKGEKPKYQAIPLTHDEHAMQHQKGESIFCPPDWYMRQCTKYLTMWINGVQPPMPEEQKANWKKEYIIEHAGQMIALYLMLKKHFSRKDAPAIKCTLQRHIKRRTEKQNNAQWGVIYSQALEYYKEHPADLVRDVLNSIRFSVDIDFVHGMFRRLFNNGKSTAGLNTIESKQYFEDIRGHFLHEYNFEIHEPINPNDYYLTERN